MSGLLVLFVFFIVVVGITALLTAAIEDVSKELSPPAHQKKNSQIQSAGKQSRQVIAELSGEYEKQVEGLIEERKK